MLRTWPLSFSGGVEVRYLLETSDLFFDKMRIMLFTLKAGCKVERAHSIVTARDSICPDSQVCGKAAPWLQNSLSSWGECFS